jgi:hypothetical protein
VNPILVGVQNRYVLAGHVTPVLASLPRSFIAATPAEVVAVDGDGPWSDGVITAIADGARGVMVAEPGPVPVDAVDAAIAAAAEAGVAVRLARQWASNPAVA